MYSVHAIWKPSADSTPGTPLLKSWSSLGTLCRDRCCSCCARRTRGNLTRGRTIVSGCWGGWLRLVLLRSAAALLPLVVVGIAW
ncbi:hypothetical protein HYQ46_002817 [Verticillium longisporum]|nr:hypothetical protein HYQ46_002817 [Verticillium longisporum]